MPDGLTSRSIPALPMLVRLLGPWFADQLCVADARVVDAVLLPGGAVQHNWRIDLDVDGDTQAYVLRVGPDVPLPESISKADEFAILSRVYADGVPVPEPLWFRDEVVPFFVSRMCPGDTARDELTKRPDNAALLRDLGTALAGIHGLDTGIPETRMSPKMRVEMLSSWIDDISEVPTPVADEIAAGLAWLRAHMPDESHVRHVHRDFRTGNFLVEDGRLVAVLDWEFAGWGDPHEDIGWFCAECWRGNAPTLEAGGLGERGAFYDAYVAAGGARPEPARVRFWEIFAHLRWSIIALQQGARARAGAYPAWELEEAEARVPGLLRTVAGMTR